jgi:hypothetical protein
MILLGLLKNCKLLDIELKLKPKSAANTPDTYQFSLFSTNLNTHEVHSGRSLNINYFRRYVWLQCAVIYESSCFARMRSIDATNYENINAVYQIHAYLTYQKRLPA